MVSDAQKRAVIKYTKKTYDQLNVRLKKGEREKVNKAAEMYGISLNQFVVEAIEKELARLGIQ